MPNDDLTLLREYSRNNSEDAFAALVSRHVNLVYSVAMRAVREPHSAEEITQAVFIILARKADGFDDKVIISGWLCRTARYAAANALTIQRRRQQREQEAHMQTIVNEPDPETWMQIAPLLDTAMEKLGRKDHDALVLRFFENKNFADVGTALGASEDAAKMRVGRALEKLHRYFKQHGISSTTAIIAGAMSTSSVQTAPVELARVITRVAVTKGIAAGTSTSTLVAGALKIMAWSNIKTAVLVGAAAIVVIFGATDGMINVYEHSHPIPTTPENAVRRLESPRGGGYFPRSSWVFAGYDDPRSTVMSALWAVRERNTATIMDCASPALLQRDRDGFARQNPAEAVPWPEYLLQNADSLTNLAGFYFMDQVQVSKDTVAVHLHATNDPRGEYAFLLKQTGNAWKLEEFR